MNDDKENFDVSNPWVLVGCFSFIIFLWLLSCTYFFNIHTEDSQKAGTLGDTFGVINSLFSGLTVAGLVYTILLQRKEITEARKESKRQKEWQESEGFQNTFFNLLTMHQNLIPTLKVKITFPALTEYTGREVFSFINSNLFNGLSDRILLNPITLNQLSEFKKIYSTSLSGDASLALNLYFESLHSILFFVYINRNEIGKTNELQYYEIVRSQMNLIERTLFFYYLSLENTTFTRHLKSLLTIEMETKFIVSTDFYVYENSHINLKEYWPAIIGSLGDMPSPA